jgi:hypothetical protein
MKSNVQILSDVNHALDAIRSRKKRISELRGGLAVINGKTQDQSAFSLGKELRIELSFYDRDYMHKIYKHYETAMVFVRRGINEEIEIHEKAIANLEQKLSEINLSDLSKDMEW